MDPQNPAKQDKYPNLNKGRRLGAQARKSAIVQKAIADLTEKNLPRMQEWLELVAKEDPKEALKIMIALMEYNIPKLARIEADVTAKGTFIIVDDFPHVDS